MVERRVTEAEIEQIAERAARRTMEELFEVFGADITTPEGRKAIQDDFSWTREAREGSKTLRKAGIGAMVASLVTGVALALWKGVAVLSAVWSRVP